jgi:hypothetical protein
LAGDDGAACVIFLLEGIVEACLHQACHWVGFWMKITCALSMMMASEDVFPLLGGFIGSLLQSCLCLRFLPVVLGLFVLHVSFALVSLVVVGCYRTR